MRRKRMMMMMATSPSMISGEILTRTRRMGKRIRSQVMGTKLKRKVPRFLKRRGQDHDLGRGRREEDRPLAVGPEVAQNDRGEQDGQGAPSRAPRNELEPELRIKSWARAPMQI